VERRPNGGASTAAIKAAQYCSAHDSLSGQLLGRAVDQEVIDDWYVELRNDATN